MYIREAHAADEWRLGDVVEINQHKSLEDRMAAAKQLTEHYGYTVPVFVDSMGNDLCENYAAWPERYFVISPAGEVLHISSPADELGFNRIALRKLLLDIAAASSGAVIPSDDVSNSSPSKSEGRFPFGSQRCQELMEVHLVTGSFSGSATAELKGPAFVPPATDSHLMAA